MAPPKSITRTAILAVAVLLSSPTSFAERDASDHHDPRSLRRRLSATFSDPKSVETKVPMEYAPSAPIQPEVNVNDEARRNCQFIFVLGAEGALQQDIEPVISELASLQGGKYKHPRSGGRRKDLFNRYLYNLPEFYGHPTLDDIAADPTNMIPKVMEALCPPDGAHRIYYGDKSFPMGSSIQRNPGWRDMSVEEIAAEVLEGGRPTNLLTMLRLFSPYADIKFLALHRPYLNTIARYSIVDGGAVVHSRVVAGHMMAMAHFLNQNVVDTFNGSRLWTVLCMDRLLSTSYQSFDAIKEGRKDFVKHLAHFLGWPVTECDHCFLHWHEVRNDPVKSLGLDNLEAISEDVRKLDGVWPPRDEAMSLGVDQCLIDPVFPVLVGPLSS